MIDILSIISIFKFLSWCTAVLVHSLAAPQAHTSGQVTLCRLQELRSITMLISRTRRSWGDFIYLQVGSESASTSIFQLYWPVGLFCVKEPAQKNLSQP